MSWIPAFELGIWNAWIFMIWQIIIPILLTFIVKEKSTIQKLSASVPMKLEKTSNTLSMVLLIVAFIISIFLPLQLINIWFNLGLLIFLMGLIIDLMALHTFRKVYNWTLSVFTTPCIFWILFDVHQYINHEFVLGFSDYNNYLWNPFRACCTSRRTVLSKHIWQGIPRVYGKNTTMDRVP